MKALDRKLLRDLGSLKTQVVSIALVIACGIGAFIGSLSTYTSLMGSRDHYYATARFAHVFATAVRAPASLLEKVRAIPGVSEAEARVVRDAQLSIEGVGPPMVARLIGIDFARRPGMNRLTLSKGRWPLATRDEVVVNERFFEARGLALGDRVRVLVNGKLERLAVVGTVLTPEYIYPTRGTGMPDDEWFAILWIDAQQLAAAFDMQGAFNSLLIRVAHGASIPGTIAAVDLLLAPYGGLGAVGRADQMSDKILSQEINQQRIFGTVLPAIFLAVAAFILNVVLHRQVNAQRGEIAALKALGYDDRRIALHYLYFAGAIVLLGAVLGIALGMWLGLRMTVLYSQFFHFPEFEYGVPLWVGATGVAISLAAAFGGTLAAIRGVVRMRAAEALRAPAPARFRPLLIERLGYQRLLTPAQRMVMRNIERKPVRAAVTVAGIAGSLAILIGGTFWGDAIDWFMEVQFSHVNRGDVQVAFAEAVPRSARFDLARLPGVSEVEVTRAIPVKLTAGHRSYRTALTGVDDQRALLQILDKDLSRAQPVPDGLLLTRRLAERLGVAPGDSLHVALLDGKRIEADVRVAATVGEMAGMNAWMRTRDLNRLAGEGDVVSMAQLRVDAAEEKALLERLKHIPAAAVVIVNRTLVDTFRETNARNVLFFTAVLTAFAATIAVGVVYNNARIQLAERSWELASLRVLGFTRREVSVLLLAELALEIIVALPVGLFAGFALALLLVSLMPHELLEFPLVILPKSYLYAAVIVAAAGAASAFVVSRRIDELDLVAVLKTRE